MKQIQDKQSVTLTVAEMTRFLMPLRDSVDLVNYAFKNANQGDLFIRKAPASTMDVLLKAITNIMRVPDHPIEIIGWRHGEKLYETLASSQELSTAEDLGDYWRLRTDLRGLDYKQFFTEGDETVAEFEDFHSHNARQLSVAEVEALLLSLPEVQALLSTT